VSIELCGQWRDPDSNEGEHDFQSCDQRSLTGSEFLLNSEFFVGSPNQDVACYLQSFALWSGTEIGLGARSRRSPRRAQ